jgi:hypothetical protein
MVAPRRCVDHFTGRSSGTGRTLRRLQSRMPGDEWAKFDAVISAWNKRRRAGPARGSTCRRSPGNCRATQFGGKLGRHGRKIVKSNASRVQPSEASNELRQETIEACDDAGARALIRSDEIPVVLDIELGRQSRRRHQVAEHDADLAALGVGGLAGTRRSALGGRTRFRQAICPGALAYVAAQPDHDVREVRKPAHLHGGQSETGT